MHRRKLWRASRDAVTIWLISLLAVLLTSASASAQQTVTNSQLQTWWHSNYELNATTAVADNAVRRSTHYDVRVGSGSSPSTYYDSYTYMSIPRGGRDKWGYSEEDGAEFADSANLTMSWSSFLYSTDAWVEVSLRGGQTISSIDEVTIRPTNLNFQKQLVDPNTIRIRVPYASTGYRFSVEFNNQLYTAYNDMSGVSGQLTTQAGGNREVHTEPRNALLIFAEPMLSGSEANRLIPHDSDGTIYYVPEGQVNNLNNVSAEIVYFRPGTYYMPWNYHALLPAHVKWVYLAPGAFVKGAFRFPHDNQGVYKVTGYGALSGEKYVYEADTANGYQHSTGSNCHASCVKMLQFQSSNAQQYLDLQGVTIVEPPYHSFVVYGNEDTFQMRVENYKQVGSWYWQTDGIELYTNSTMKNTFFNANDDVLKIYHSGVTIDNTVIWKNENGPVIQWGWVPRNIQNITVRNTNVIHNRMYWKDVKINTCVVNASPHWEDTGSTTRGDPNSWVRNILIENTRVEGKVNCAVRIYALSSTENIHVKNLAIDAWNNLDIGSQVSHLKRYSNSGGQKVTLGAQGSAGASGKGIKLETYTVGGVAVTRAADNWRANQLGRLGFDADTYDNWDAFGGGTQNPSASRWVGGTFTNWALTSMAATGSGIYELTRSLTAGNHQLKFADTGNWTGRDWGGANGLTGTAVETTGGGPNITFNVTASGEYLIRFNSNTLQYSIASTTTTQPVWVAGTFSNWSLGSMTATSTGYQAVRTLSAGNHELKFANTGNWSGTDWGNATGLSGTVTETTGGLPNVKFTIAQSGSYAIRFNLQTLAYSISPTP